MVPKDLFVMRVTYLYLLIRKSILSCGNYFIVLYSKDLRQDEIGGLAFIICGFGNSTQKKRRFVFVKL